MKKKILLPFLSLACLTTTISPILLTSCGGGNDGKKEEEHVTTEYSTPVVNTEFVIKFKLDDNYSLNMNDSTIEFTDSNAVISLNRCVVDSTNKTITVPANLVTSTTVKVSLKSIKSETRSKEEIKKAMEFVFGDYDNKNLTLAGDCYGLLRKDGKVIEQQSLPLISIKAVNHDVRYQQGEYKEGHKEMVIETSQLQKSSDIGWWGMTETNPGTGTFNAHTCWAEYVMYDYVVGLSFVKTLDELINGLVYDPVQNLYKYQFDYEFESPGEKDIMTITVKVTLDKEKNFKSLVMDQDISKSTGEFGHVVYNYSIKDQGTTSFDLIKPDKITYMDYVKPADFTYENNMLIAKNKSSKLFMAPTLTNYTSFDPSKKTYVYMTGYRYSGLSHITTKLFSGTKELQPKETKEGSGDYYFELVDHQNYQTIEINPNTLNKTDDLKFVWSSIFGGAESKAEDVKTVIITQTPM